MILETKRLLLKTYKIEFAEEVYNVIKQKEIADTMMKIPHPYPRYLVDSWISYLQKSFEQGTAYEFAVFLKKNDRYIGNCGLIKNSTEHKSAEIGYFIDIFEWGKGYATEACKKIIDYSFRDLQLNRVYGRCMVSNRASRRVMEKAGMVFEGCHKQEILKDGVYEDINYFAILAEDYFKNKY